MTERETAAAGGMKCLLEAVYGGRYEKAAQLRFEC